MWGFVFLPQGSQGFYTKSTRQPPAAEGPKALLRPFALRPRVCAYSYIYMAKYTKQNPFVNGCGWLRGG